MQEELGDVAIDTEDRPGEAATYIHRRRTKRRCHTHRGRVWRGYMHRKRELAKL